MGRRHGFDSRTGRFLEEECSKQTVLLSFYREGKNEYYEKNFSGSFTSAVIEICDKKDHSTIRAPSQESKMKNENFSPEPLSGWITLSRDHPCV